MPELSQSSALRFIRGPSWEGPTRIEGWEVVIHMPPC